MYALVKDGAIVQWPYTLTDYKRANPQVSLPSQPTDATYTSLGLVRVNETPPPIYDEATQTVEQGQPEFTKYGQWEQTWTVRQLTADELAERNTQAAQQRARAYREEADPLFFKYQRGEATMDAWLAKVAEIKLRYPGA